jgi:VCBS repeat-containing protein
VHIFLSAVNNTSEIHFQEVFLMIHKKWLCFCLALVCILGLGIHGAAVSVDCDSSYCFSSSDFSAGELEGVCITGLPDHNAGTIYLGQRVVRVGDILTADQLALLTFQPLRTEEDKSVTVTYLPIYENKVEKNTAMTISIRGKADKAPVAEDSALETYKNLPITGKLKVHEPENDEMTFTLIRPAKRGDVTLNADGSFTYTPKKNKVGTDSFVFTATDAAGNVSRQATVTIQILKPGDQPTYADTVGKDCRFAAEWMKNTGIFIGENISGSLCFRPDQAVTRGEFLAMLVQALELQVDENATHTGFTDDAPTWLKPYLAAALRSGLTAGWPGGNVFGHQKPISGAEAAIVLQNALALPVTTAGLDHADTALQVLAENGIELTAGELLNRGQVAQLLYQASRLSAAAPGLQIFARQK